MKTAVPHRSPSPSRSPRRSPRRPRIAAKDVVFAVASTFTTTDPYDANDTLSQAMAKSFYEGLFGFDKDMKLIPVLAESYDGQQGRARLHDQAQEGRQVPRRHRLQGRRGQGEPRSRHQPGQQAQALRPLNNNIAKTEVVDDYTARITLKTPFSPFINQLAHPIDGDDQPDGADASTAARTSRSIRSAPARSSSSSGRRPTTSRSRSSTATGSKGYPKVDTITWKPVVDNNTRAAMMQTGEAHFTFPVPYEVADVLKAKPELEVVAAPSIVLRYLSMNTQQKPFDNPKVRQAIAYAINKEALAKVAFNGYADAGGRRRAAGRRVRGEARARGRTTSPRRSSC